MSTPVSPLPQATLARLRSSLQNRAAELQAEVATAEQRRLPQAAGGAPEVQDLKDLAASALQAEVSDGEIDRDRGELQAVRAALRRIEQGGYGLCADCEAVIDDSRLNAMPQALRCTACQQMAESAAHRAAGGHGGHA